MISIKDIKKIIDKRAGWIAKDAEGDVWWFQEKPSQSFGKMWNTTAEVVFGRLGYVEVEEFQGKNWADCCLPLPDTEEDWVGCLCLFWNEDEISRRRHSILMKINDASPFPYQDKLGLSWSCCRPVKPEEIKFYKEK